MEKKKKEKKELEVYITEDGEEAIVLDDVVINNNVNISDPFSMLGFPFFPPPLVDPDGFIKIKFTPMKMDFTDLQGMHEFSSIDELLEELKKEFDKLDNNR